MMGKKSFNVKGIDKFRSLLRRDCESVKDDFSVKRILEMTTSPLREVPEPFAVLTFEIVVGKVAAINKFIHDVWVLIDDLFSFGSIGFCTFARISFPFNGTGDDSSDMDGYEDFCNRMIHGLPLFPKE